MKLSPFAALILASSMAQAQTIETGLKTVSAAVRDFTTGFAAQQAKSKADELLDRVMVAMNDQPGTGEAIAKWLQDNRVDVKFSDEVQGASDHADGVRLNSSLKKGPLSYRYFGALIAREAAELEFKDFPESAQKRYMVASRMGEAYAELGGGVSMPPNFDGITDPKAAAALQAWFKNFYDPRDSSASAKPDKKFYSPERCVYFLKGQGHRMIEDWIISMDNHATSLLQEKLAILNGAGAYARDPSARDILRGQLAKNEETLASVRKEAERFSKAEGEFDRFARAGKGWLTIHPIDR
jgi:hypothetical protein